MPFITVTQRGSFNNTERFLHRSRSSNIKKILEKYGEKGVIALADATPKDSGLTAESWYYDIVEKDGYYSLHFRNRNIQNGRPIAILLQYGHATKGGGWVEGHDYINPAIKPIFDEILADVRLEVIK